MLRWAPAAGGALVADFTITRGTVATPWWSRRGGEVIGSAVGDLEIFSGVAVDRVQWNPAGNHRLIFNTSGDPQPWVNGDGAAAILTVRIAAFELVLRMADREGLGVWGFRWQLVAALQRQGPDALAVGQHARITIEA